MTPWLYRLISGLRQKKLDLTKVEVRKRIAEAACYTFASIHGQVTLQYLIQEIYDTPSHVPGNTPQDTAYNEGLRGAVKHILDLMDEHKNPPTLPEVETEKPEV